VRRGSGFDATTDFNWLKDHALSGCHVQGIANVGTSGIVVGFSKAASNNTFPANPLGRSCPEYDPNVLRRAKLMQLPGGEPTFYKSIEIPHNEKVYHQGMSLIRQCDGQMYLLGLTVNDYPGCAGNFDSCDDSIIDYAPYNPDPANIFVGAWQTTGALDNPCNGFLDLDICPNFAAGATAFVGTNHKLFAWATEHWPEGRPADLDILAWSQP
jgi:hypothetical protein